MDIRNLHTKLGVAGSTLGVKDHVEGIHDSCCEDHDGFGDDLYDVDASVFAWVAADAWTLALGIDEPSIAMAVAALVDGEDTFNAGGRMAQHVEEVRTWIDTRVPTRDALVEHLTRALLERSLVLFSEEGAPTAFPAPVTVDESEEFNWTWLRPLTEEEARRLAEEATR